MRERKLEQTEAYIEARDGEVLDRYIGPSITMARIRVSGSLLKTLLAVEAVATIDQPPQPDVTTSEAYDLTLENVPPLNGIAADAPLIGILDSGINAHPFLDDILVGSIGVPARLGTADDFGHGTRVGGVRRIR
ncbi:hypothetical protein QA644_34795 (plasmid) [Rhizobium sp. CC1099]|uniref:hypothetical protein n=1 Tax=Rhizobium sp. CC1099 TaxID=3039160 RepID=UPI0024B13713|nr:hypothetical protein [Rhizobium sp. CC1099]WFU92057.1 hypothetical protein QA644_34795 [Rhizobium sp. CC1099]